MGTGGLKKEKTETNFEKEYMEYSARLKVKRQYENENRVSSILACDCKIQKSIAWLVIKSNTHFIYKILGVK